MTARNYTKEYVRQQIGGQVPEIERDQCGECGGSYEVTPDRVYGACPAHDGIGCGPADGA